MFTQQLFFMVSVYDGRNDGDARGTTRTSRSLPEMEGTRQPADLQRSSSTHR